MRSLYEYSADELRGLVRLLESEEARTLFFPLLRRDEEIAIEDALNGLSDGTEAGTAIARHAAGKVWSLRQIANIHDSAVSILEESRK